MQTAKQRIKQLLLLMTTCFFIGVSLTSCEKELYEDGIKNSSRNISVAHVSLSSLDKTTSAKIAGKITELKSFSKRTNAPGKFEYNSALDIYVDTENGRMVNNNGKLFYTFPMFRESEEKLENIVFALLTNGELETYFARYNVTPEVFIDLPFENIQYLNPEIQKVSFTGLVWICIENQIWQQVSNEGISAGGLQPLYTYEWVTTSFTCQLVSGGGDGDDNSNNNNTNPSTGESGGGTAGTVSTSPVGLTLGQLAHKNYIKNLPANPILGSCYAAASQEFKDNLAAFFGTLDINDETVTEASIKAFADQAIMAVCGGGEVDFGNKVIIDSALKNNPCLYGVYTQLGKAPTFQNYLQNFDGNFSIANLRLNLGIDPDYPNANAVTTEPQNYLVNIMFNPTKLNRPQLDVARTFIHELIHAEIFRKLLSLAGQPNIPWTVTFINSIKNDYPGLYDYYMRYKFNIAPGQQITDAQHELMAQHYRDIIIQVMQEFDNSYTPEVYDALSWSGLMGSLPLNQTTGLGINPTKAWENLSQTERLQIISIKNTFFSANQPCQP